MKKIYLKNSYIVVEIDQDRFEFPCLFLYYFENNKYFDIRRINSFPVLGNFISINKSDISNWTNESNEVYTVDTLREFLRSYTGANADISNSVGGKSENSELNSISNQQILDGNSWEGTWEKDNYPFVVPSIISDQNVTYQVQFSLDGTTIQTSLSYIYDTSRINPPHSFQKDTRYWRIVVINNSGATATVSVHSDKSPSNEFNSPINGLMSENFSATATRPTNYSEEVAEGKRQGRTTWNKFGYNNDVDTGSEEIIASWGGSFTPPTSPDTLTIVSSNLNDTNSDGSGLKSIVITGIDENRDSQIEVVSLNGTTPVVTQNEWLGVNRIAPFLCGSSKANEGTIAATHTSSGMQLAEMPQGETVTQQCMFYVQRNHTFLLDWIHINVLKISGGGGDPEVTIKGYVYSPVANANIQIFKAKIDTAVENTIELNPYEPFPITESSVLYFTAETDRDNTSVDVRFSGKEIRNQ